MEKISKKEFWIGIAIALLALAIAIIVEPSIKDRMLDNLKLYEQALRVDNDSKVFSYAQKTNVGNVLALGNLQALQPQTIPELQGSYSVIAKVKEHYTMHTRQNCNTDSKGNETCTTETYYEWDHVRTWVSASGKYDFLGVTFSAGQLDLPGAQRIPLNATTMAPAYAGFYDNWDLYEQSLFGIPSGDDRYYFQGLPLKFGATIFVKFLNGKVSEPISGAAQLPVYYSQTPTQVIEQKKADMIFFDIGYYFFTLLLVGGCWYWLSYDKLDIE